MKKLLLLIFVGVMLTGCGSNKDDLTETTSVETTSKEEAYEETTDEISTEAETLSETTTKENKGVKENVIVPPPEYAQASPVENVNNTLFVDVSAAVRNNCNENAKVNSNALRSDWSAMANTEEEKIYMNTAINLIDSYKRLNECRTIIADNEDIVSDEDKELFAEIEDDLSVNVEIFLNANTTSIMDSNFDYSNEIDNLELSLRNKMS